MNVCYEHLQHTVVVIFRAVNVLTKILFLCNQLDFNVPKKDDNLSNTPGLVCASMRGLKICGNMKS